MQQVRTMTPRGHYLAGEAGRLAGVSGDRIGQWARRGYIRSSQSDRPPRVYTYQDIAEAILVHDLIDRIEHSTLREGIAKLRAVYGDWPLASAPLLVASGAGGISDTTGTPAVARSLHLVDAGQVRDVVTGQIAVPQLEGDLQRVANLLRRGGWPARELPELEHVEVDPDRLSGRPTIRGRRIAVEDVARIAEAASGRKVLRSDYDLSDDQIDDAIRWWQRAEELAA